MGKPELLAPAGDMERLRMAVLYGADAVYLAGTSFGMRSFAGNFSPEELPEAVAFAHAHGVRVHVTVNTMPRGDELPALPAHLRLLNDSGVDALILADLGVFRMAQREAPNCELHISTQVSIANAACAAAWHELGAKRVVLARELSLEEIRVIRRDTPPELELETFAHGAMCVSYSGRCLLSNYMTGRDSNRGACAQPCRYQYALMEEKRPGEYFPVFEDEKGTYIMNSRDMCMIDHLAELAEAGVDCIKVEGRAKSAYYAAIITGAYRHALDAVAAGEPVDPVWRDEVEHVSHRRYSTGFFFGQPGQYTESSRYIRDWQVCAIVTDCTPDGLATLSLRNKFAAGDEVEIVGPDTRPFSVTVPVMQDADGLHLAIDTMQEKIKDLDYDVVVGPESRGFIFGTPIAYNNHKPFVLIRKKGKLPRETVSREYALEYGTGRIEMHRDSIKPGQKVVIIDDLIATGGTVEAAIKLVEELGGEVVKVVFLMELAGLKGRERLAGYDVASVIRYEGK